MNRFNSLLFLFLLFLVGCGGGVDEDLVNSGKTHVQNIEKVSKQLADDPDNAELKSKLKEHVLFYNTVLNSAGDGKKAALEKEIFKDMDENAAKSVKELIRKTK